MNLHKTIALLLAAGSLLPATALPVAKPDFRAHKDRVATSGICHAAPVVPDKQAYAWCTRDRNNVPLGIVSFQLNNPSALTSVKPLPNLAYAGCFADGKYYFDRYRTYEENGTSTWAHIAFSSVDLATGAITDIKDWSDEYFVINDMTYDYTTGKILAMGRTFYIDDFLPGFQFECSVLMSIHPTTGVVTEEKLFIDWANGAMTNPTYYNIACDLNGTIYSVNQNGDLVTLDRNNEYAEHVIGRTTLNPAHTTQSMEFDHTTGTLYWCADFQKEAAALVVVDTASGLASRVGETGSDAHLVGLYIPFEVPSQAAPGAVSQFEILADPQGARTATLSWTNPAKSYGGYNLTTISSVKVLRNNIEVASLTGTPGQSMTWTDNVPADALYSYTVYAVNSAGNGLASGLTRWIGLDVPMAVGNLGIGRNNDGSAILQWTEPDKGAHAGVIDTATLGYKITRFPDGTVVAADAKGTEFHDTTVPRTGRYYYIVESHTATGIGESARTAEIALGNSIESFPWSTLFADQSEFDIWTVLNPNGGSTWKWKSRTAGGYESMAMYEYDNANDGDDYLVSPDLLLKKDARYKVSFVYAGANAFHHEKLAVTFGQGKTPEAQSQVLANLNMDDGTFRKYEVDLPEVSETGYYNFAFHALSEKGNYNIYVTDVTVSMTVAPPDEPGDYDFKTPENLEVEVDNNTGNVILRWNESAQGGGTPTQNIFEDFESIPKWTLNPQGEYGWTYIDGDQGIPYVDDYYENAYPTDGMPLAAMVMAPYELHEYVYKPNPPHSGDQYLLFKSNYCAGDRSRPAPAPDDWFISPRLNFQQDFVFRFWCKADPDAEGWDPLWNTEKFLVGYSLSGNTPDDFIWATDEPQSITTAFDEWKKMEYSIPAAAKYVCIRYVTPDQGYWFMVDDVFIGVENPAGARAKSEPNFLHYEVMVNDDIHGRTLETTHTVSGLPDGSHVAKVTAVYAEGRSGTVAVPFTLATSGCNRLGNNPTVWPNPASEAVHFNTVADNARLYSPSGILLREIKHSDMMPLEGIPAGPCLLILNTNGIKTTHRLIVK